MNSIPMWNPHNGKYGDDPYYMTPEEERKMEEQNAPPPHYRVVEDDFSNGCKHCGHGKFFTITSGEGDDEIGVSTSWGDKGLAENICDLMNDAYEAGKEADPWTPGNRHVNAEEQKLVNFFRSKEGDRLGRDGDHDNLSPAETAIRAMRKLLKVKK